VTDAIFPVTDPFGDHCPHWPAKVEVLEPPLTGNVYTNVAADHRTQLVLGRDSIMMNGQQPAAWDVSGAPAPSVKFIHPIISSFCSPLRKFHV